MITPELKDRVLTELVNTGLINMESNLHGLANNFNRLCTLSKLIYY